MPELSEKNLKQAKLIEQYSKYIDSPVQRLKFLNSAFNEEHQRSGVMRLPFVSSLPERARLAVELSKVLPPTKPAPLGVRLTWLAYRLRLLVYTASVALIVSMGAGIAYLTTKLITSMSVVSEAKDGSTPVQVVAANNGGAVATIGSEAGLTL